MPIKNIRPFFVGRKGGAIKVAEIIPNEPDTVSTVEGNFLSIFYYSFILLSLSVSIISKFRV